MGFLWVCGVRVDSQDLAAWDLVGVYTDRSLAVQACRDENHFLFPVVANMECRSETKAPAGVEWPHREITSGHDWEWPRIPR